MGEILPTILRKNRFFNLILGCKSKIKQKPSKLKHFSNASSSLHNRPLDLGWKLEVFYFLNFEMMEVEAKLIWR